ncbi:MAG: GNAT family N-acetyltransferase [Desulfobulbus sp.]|nr:GNAT family N-acetyltransferase [Desulfobulbus sp.]
MSPSNSFAAISYCVSSLSLNRLEPFEAESIANQLAVMDPWARLGYGAPALECYLAGRDSALQRFSVQESGETVGVVCIRLPWLRGPSLELLAVFPPAQGRGLGRMLLAWIEEEARLGADNLWTVTSEFNTRARLFYQTAGFVEVAPLTDLVASGYSEILLRKRLSPKN